MGSLKRSCLRWGLLYFALALVFSLLIYARFPKSELALGVGFVTAIPAWLSVAYLYGMKFREARLIAAAIRGGKPLDGQRVAIVGKVASTSELVESPLERKRCVLYE